MAPSVFLLYILFTIGFLSKRSTGAPQLELGVQFYEEPQNLTGTRGKSLSIPCRLKTARQKEPFFIVWYHDNKVMNLQNDRRRTVFQNGTLHFSKLIHKRNGLSDQGEYRCVAVRENGSLSSRPGYLRISSLPETFLRHPTDQNVEAGSNVRLACIVDYKSDIEIVWEKNGEEIWLNPEKYAVVYGSDIQGSILYIFNAIPQDSGNYRCIAKSVLTHKQRHSSIGSLTVVPPTGNGGGNYEKAAAVSSLTFLPAQQSTRTFSSPTREIEKGKNITLACVAKSHSSRILSWSFQAEGQNTSQNLYNVTRSGHDLLNIKNVTRRHAGWYTCTAVNDGNDKNELKIRLKVTIPPVIREKSDGIVFRTSRTIRFRCTVYGNPIPEVYWLKDGNVLNITGRIKHRISVNESLQLRHSELIVSSSVASDAGIYQCMAKNSLGWTWAASRLVLNATKPAPGAPERVSCEPISSSQIKLSWDVSNSTNQIKAFSIHYHLTDNGEEMQKVMPSDSRSIQIDKLLPFSNYTFYLRLYMDSASEFSEKAVCQTGEEVPIDAPEKKLQIITQNSVYVTWVPLDKKRARGVIIKYKIQWRSSKSPSSTVVEVTGNVLNYTITGLIPGKKYDVRILAATSKGFPQSDLPWETFEIPLNFNSNIPSPPKIVLQPINSSGIEIRWKLPNRTNNVIGYKIYYRKQNGSQVGPIIVPADTNKYVVSGLEPETWYEIMVSGFTEDDDGESGVSLMHTLSNLGTPSKFPPEFSSFPEAPVSLEADPISPVAINLTWTVPFASSAFNNIKHYTVCFSPVQNINHDKNKTVNCLKSLDNKISIVGLNPYTLYEFKVRAHDMNGQESVFSQIMECHTLEGVPSQVIDVNWKAINRSVVQVSWKEPVHINGVLKGYTLFYTDDSSLPVDSWNAKIVPATTCETQLTELTSNVKYYFIVRALTNAGLGSYASPKEIFIPSKYLAGNKQNDHYIGIIVGLGIGIFCIIMCTTCILCRRRCLKRQLSQEFEVPPRQSNGSVCQRNRDFVADSPETEYYTFLSGQSEHSKSSEITMRDLNAKVNYANGTANEIKMSLMKDNKILIDGSGAKNIHSCENIGNDRYLKESSFLYCKSYSAPHRTIDCKEMHSYLDRHNDSSAPLLTERRKRLESAESNGSDSNDSEAEGCPKINQRSSRIEPVNNRTDKVIKAFTERRVTHCDRTNLNSILENPEFRFSNSSNEFVNKGCGYARQKNFTYKDSNGETGNGLIGSETTADFKVDYGVFTNTKLPLHFMTKEIIQES